MNESSAEREALLAVIESQQETFRPLYAYTLLLAPGAVTASGHAGPAPGALQIQGGPAQLASGAPAALAGANGASDTAPPRRRPRFARELLAAGWLVLLVIGV